MKFPFDELPNTATITCCHIVDEKMPILYVAHDEEDGTWQFSCGKNHDMSDARVVSLYEIVMLDNSIVELANMPCGYIAKKKNIKAKWCIRKR